MSTKSAEVKGGLCSTTRRAGLQKLKLLHQLLLMLQFIPFLSFQMSSHFSPEASAAFGRRKTGPNTGFNNTAAAAFGRPSAAPTNAFAAFGKPAAYAAGNGFTNSAAAAFGKPTASAGGFDNSAAAAFGKGVQRNSGFDADASAAFGKKPTRRQEEEARAAVILPKRSNDLSSIMDHYLGASEPAHTYSQSAFGVKRAAAAAAPKVVEEAWPELGGGKPKAIAKPAVSFSDVMKKRAEADAAEAEAKAREEALLAARSRQDRLDIGGIFISRPPVRKSKPARYDDDDNIESDLDYVKGDDTAGMGTNDDGTYYDQEEDEKQDDAEDEYWKR